ncbi:MAG: lipocalin-like domain-containing protein [Bryobacterales bacterium]|nr:lipocalin-like domain-containing protein [Bryobacterales bacterium]
MTLARTFALTLILVLAALPATEWKLALPGYRYAFPADHFSHPQFQTEWWYFTGNLQAADGGEYGYELTFFRQGRNAQPTMAENRWDTGQLYLAHLAFTDIGGNRFRHSERLNRGGPGLAGADEKTRKIWNGNWSVRLTGTHDWKLEAVHADFTLRLDLSSEKQPVLHGENGVHQKSAGVGKASHYISLTRLRTTGEIVLEGKRMQVRGSSWMDHEFFTHSMAGDQTGWDWFAIQLDDGTELMLYRLRRRDGSIEPLSGGTFVDRSGQTTRLRLEDFSLRQTGTWTSPESGANYPVEWEIAVPRAGLKLSAKPRIQAQELRSERKIGPSYWEGAMRFEGTREGKPVQGAGYLELTGYADEVDLSGGAKRGGMTR